MNGVGVFGVLSWVLQLTIPSYSLRLVRRFGTARVGWFVVMAFTALALLYLLKPLKPMSVGTASGATIDLMFSIAAVLLVIGMGHVEAILSAGQQAEREERRVRSECQSRAEAQAAELAEENRTLSRKVASLEKSEAALRQAETEYRFLFVENPQPMWIFDLRSFRFLAVNRAALTLYGFTHEEFMGMTARHLVPAEGVARFQRDVARPCSVPQSRGSWQHRRKDGTGIDVEVTALDLRYAGCPARLILAGDLGRRINEEKQFYESQKQDVARQLAGGVAHHFNNTLSIISGHVSLLTQQTQDAKSADHLSQISAAVNCAAGLSRQLLIASSRFAMREEPIDLNSLLRTLQPMLTRLVGKDITVQTIYGAELPRIPGDVRLLEHILVNLVLNARDAMPRGGRLTIRTESVRIGEPGPHERRPISRPGNFVRLAVRDTGCGMTPEVRSHLYEPFFTTRGIGKGRGLGLASVYGAVNQHTGWVECSTEPGKGTEFRVFLPEILPTPRTSETEFRRRMRC